MITFTHLCKYTSFKANIPYVIVATAPSMDGYASTGAAMITDNMKVTYNAHVPEAIIADTKILKDAPMDMVKESRLEQCWIDTWDDGKGIDSWVAQALL